MLDVALVGTGGMIPLPNRWLASTLIRFDGHLILFDCGEGTQISLRSLGWGLKDIGLILISHLHADHVAGLPGLLLTLGNSARTEPVDIVGPLGLVDAVRGLLTIAPHLPFEVRCLETAGGALNVGGGLSIRAAASDHRVPCVAYRLSLARSPRFLAEKAAVLGVPRESWKTLQSGIPYDVDGLHVDPRAVLGPPRAGLALGLVTDTRPTSALAELVAGVDLLVCEGTFGKSSDGQRAIERKHMTFAEAATFARDARAKRLILTHFSAALTDPEGCADEATAIFPRTTIGFDHFTTTLRFPQSA